MVIIYKLVYFKVRGDNDKVSPTPLGGKFSSQIAAKNHARKVGNWGRYIICIKVTHIIFVQVFSLDNLTVDFEIYCRKYASL